MAKKKKYIMVKGFRRYNSKKCNVCNKICLGLKCRRCFGLSVNEQRRKFRKSHKIPIRMGIRVKTKPNRIYREMGYKIMPSIT